MVVGTKGNQEIGNTNATSPKSLIKPFLVDVRIAIAKLPMLLLLCESINLAGDKLFQPHPCSFKIPECPVKSLLL